MSIKNLIDREDFEQNFAEPAITKSILVDMSHSVKLIQAVVVKCRILICHSLKKFSI